VVDDPGARVGQPQFLEDVELQRLREFRRVHTASVHYRHADALQVLEPVQRVERRLRVASEVCRRGCAVHDDRILRFLFGRVPHVGRGVEPHVGELAAVQLLEERLEPVRVFVVDGDGLVLLGLRHGGAR
jgi:hypothetical protein